MPLRMRWRRSGTDIRRWTEIPAGGHFAAMEQPEALAREEGRARIGTHGAM
jgi:microsomal epoxide hydrolase